VDITPAPAVKEESALVVVVPEAESVAGPWRARLDPSAVQGVPAHVTILYPFVPPAQLDQRLFAEAGELFRGFGAFDYELDEVRWFGEDVVWMSPRPVEPFLRLLDLAYRRWPEFPPYGRRDLEPTPHLTLGQGAAMAEMVSAAKAVTPSLPIRARAAEVSLLATRGEPSWERVRSFPL
jgi:2'-5' RNA ligase